MIILLPFFKSSDHRAEYRWCRYNCWAIV